MQDIFTFAAHHWLIVGLTALALIWVLVEEARRQTGGGSNLSPQQVVQMINHDDAVIVDIRDPAAFDKSHIINAINVPQSDLEQNQAKFEKYRAKPLILVDAAGRGSVEAMAKLRKKGFDKLYLLAGGMSAWQAANMPTKGK